MDRRDLTIKTGADGKEIRTFRSPKGVTYRIEKKFDQGGVGMVFLLTALDGPARGKNFVLKEYPPHNNDAAKKDQQRNIRKNLQTLIQQPVLDDNNAPLHTMVPPLEIIEFPHTGTTGSFGYTMDFVNLSDYVSVRQLRKKMPDAEILCKLCIGISHFFSRLAGGAGLCYKDINEGNIYLHPRTGDLRVIDNDNVGPSEIRTISGTRFYMAPEVQTGHCDPDKHTDRFQLASYLYRMLLGGYAYEGPRAVKYMIDHNLSVDTAAPVVLGSDAVFIFDPVDKSNSAAAARLPASPSSADIEYHKNWKQQTEKWERLPPVLRKNFTQTFTCTKPEMREGRITPRQWEQTFLSLQQSLISCPKCKVKTFGASKHCFYCGYTFATTTCKACGKKTPKHHPVCLECGKAWNHSSVAMVKCPHCSKDTPATNNRCKTCGKFVKVICKKCGATSPGTSTHCPKCKTPLFLPCPSCGKSIPLDASQCAYCSQAIPRDTVKCPGCMRINQQWHQKCIECGHPLPPPAKATKQPAAKPAAKTATKTVSVTVRMGATEPRDIQFSYLFGAGKVLYADMLFPELPHIPLCILRFRAEENLFAIENKTGHDIVHLPGTSTDVKDKSTAAPDKIVQLFFPHTVKFTDELQCRFTSIQ